MSSSLSSSSSSSSSLLATTASSTASAPRITLASLTDDILIESCSYLGVSDVLGVSRSCRALAYLRDQPEVWRALCQTWYCLDNRQTDVEWKGTFRSFFDEFPHRFLPHYRFVHRVWQCLQAVLLERFPAAHATLQRGLPRASLVELDQRLQAVHIRLPPDYALATMLVNGQRPARSEEEMFTGVLGGFSVYDLVCNDLKLLPFASCGIDSGIQFWLDSQGRVVRRVGRQSHFHVIAPSFRAFMEQHVARLEQRAYSIDALQGILRFPDADPCGSTTVTRGIRARVSVLWVPEYSAPAKFLFAYRVRLDYVGSPDEQHPVSCQLTTRKWTIVDATGKSEEVNGPGVIGQYPRMYPSCPPFAYESLCPLPTPSGSMGGSFRFRIDGSTDEFDVLIGECDGVVVRLR